MTRTLKRRYGFEMSLLGMRRHIQIPEMPAELGDHQRRFRARLPRSRGQ